MDTEWALLLKEKVVVLRSRFYSYSQLSWFFLGPTKVLVGCLAASSSLYLFKKQKPKICDRRSIY